MTTCSPIEGTRWTVVFRPLAAAALVLATAGVSAADHYGRVPRGVARKDRSVLEALHRLTYAPKYGITVEAGFCDCLEPTCDGPDDFMITCGAEIVPHYQGYLSAVRRSSRQTCVVCGCAQLEPIELTVTPVCAGF